VEGAPEALRCLESIYSLNRGVLGGGSKLSKLEGVVKRITEYEKRVQEAALVEKQLQEEHTALFGESCPLCGHSMAG
jgi:hypothetical protein